METVIEEDLEGPMVEVFEVVDPILKVYNNFTDTIKNVKEAWEGLKTG